MVEMKCYKLLADSGDEEWPMPKQSVKRRKKAFIIPVLI